MLVNLLEVSGREREMRVQSIKAVLVGLTPEEIIAGAADAIRKLYERERYSRAFAGLVFPECWSDEHGGLVDYSPWFALREDLGSRLGIRDRLRAMEYPNGFECEREE